MAQAQQLPEPEVLQDGSRVNPVLIRCRRCQCKILPARVGTLATLASPVRLPLSATTTDAAAAAAAAAQAGDEPEEETEFFSVTDVFAFDNIGVSKPAENLPWRVLTCGECEVGVLGYVDDSTAPATYRLSRRRVAYDAAS